MKKSVIFSLLIIFFLFINIQPASASATCWNLGLGYFDVKDTCSRGEGDHECGVDAYCNYWDALCAAWGGPCEPLDCKNCQVAESIKVESLYSHQCVDTTAPAQKPDCCSYSCVEGGLSGSYSPELYDQTCYAYTNKLNDANNCGTCKNKCPGDQICSSGSCECPIAGQKLIDNVCTIPTCMPCIDNTPCEPSTCSNVKENLGKRCVNNGLGVGELVVDPINCPVGICRDTDFDGASPPNFTNTAKKGTCTDKDGNTYTDVCSSTVSPYSVKEYYCNAGTQLCENKIITCAGSDTCSDGQCNPDGGGGGGGGDACRDGMQDGDETGVDCGGSCAACESCPKSCGYNAVDPFGNSHCISGCPIDYPSQTWACVPGLPGGCGGMSGCASYDPSKGETPCTLPPPDCESFYICDRQSVCTKTGCRNIYETPITDSSDPLYTQYCDKCNACQDGVQNCGESSTDVCSTESCMITYNETCGFINNYGGDMNSVCSNSDSYSCSTYSGYGAGCCNGGAIGVSGPYFFEYVCEKSATLFNPKTCSDGYENCDENCTDGGDRGMLPGTCITGEETDNSYQIIFDPLYPPTLIPGLTFINFSVDMASWNCADGIDNDHDCLIDCDDPDSSATATCNKWICRL